MSIQSPNNGTISEINITPLVDVMLVLLIIFMVAAPVLEKERSQKELDENRDRQQRLIALNLPVLDNRGATSQEAKVLRLTVDNALAVRLDGEALASCGKGDRDFESWVPCWDEIQSKLTSGASAKAAKEGGVAVDASDLVPFGFTVGILHRIYRANIDKVSLFPNPGM